MKVKQSLLLKILAFLLAVAAFGSAAAMATYQIANIESLWFDDEYNYTVSMLLDESRVDVERLTNYYRAEPGTLTVYQREIMEVLEEELSSENTNFRWCVTDEEGAFLWGNAQAVPDDAVLLRWHELDIGSADTPNVSLTEYGDLILWLDPDLPVDDSYKAAVLTLEKWEQYRYPALGCTVVLILLGIALTVWLCAASGHRRGYEGISLCWFHYIPGDLLLAVWIFCGILLCMGADNLLWNVGDLPMDLLLLAAAAIAVGFAVLVTSLLITFVARCKDRVVLRHTVIGWLCIWLWRGVKAFGRAVPLIWKVALAGVVYILVCVVSFFRNIYLALFLWPLITLLLLAYLCWWAYQWKQIRIGTNEIIGGNTGYTIGTRLMPPDLKAHADELNNLGQAIGAAVEERMRSEHFKAELITNVSHDLKTPLTSIINYVDLLKKEDIDNSRAAEYIEVLDRKSQRLKKLTEDLVEASKASTGAVTIVKEPIDLLQFTHQALAEYEDRLASQGITLVRTMPGQPVWVEADGRHLWRVIDNLLSNCAKYALAGTRVYVEVQTFSDCAKFSIKNISREELNIPPERLVERFVRGDASRTAEGSGLGLSIARSLTDLQGGSFDISIDGDLFKTTVTLPLAANKPNS